MIFDDCYIWFWWQMRTRTDINCQKLIERYMHPKPCHYSVYSRELMYQWRQIFKINCSEFSFQSPDHSKLFGISILYQIIMGNVMLNNRPVARFLLGGGGGCRLFHWSTTGGRWSARARERSYRAGAFAIFTLKWSDLVHIPEVKFLKICGLFFRSVARGGGGGGGRVKPPEAPPPPPTPS